MTGRHVHENFAHLHERVSKLEKVVEGRASDPYTPKRRGKPAKVDAAAEVVARLAEKEAALDAKMERLAALVEKALAEKADGGGK